VLGKFLEALYNKVFINIVVGRSKTNVYVEVCNKKGVVDSNQMEFDTTTLNSQIIEFVDSYSEESPYHYISILDTSASQGAIPTCKNMSLFCDIEFSKSICVNNKWAYYTSKYDLNTLQDEYKTIGVDFIFSPFSLLSKFFKDKIDSHLSMFILVEDNYISLSIFDNSELLYAEHLDMELSEDSEELTIDDESSMEEVDLDLGEGIDLDEIDAMDDMGSLDDFGEIEDLDSIEEIDEFSEEEEVEEEFEEAIDDVLSGSEPDDFNEDYQRFSLIQSAVKNFYKDEKFQSKFVESVYIADGVGISGDLKKYLEEEMFLSVYIRHLDLCGEVCEMAKAEVNEA